MDARRYRASVDIGGTFTDLLLLDEAKGNRPVYFPEASGYLDCSVYDRYQLAPGMVLLGPGIIEERESTVASWWRSLPTRAMPWISVAVRSAQTPVRCSRRGYMSRSSNCYCKFPEPVGSRHIIGHFLSTAVFGDGTRPHPKTKYPLRPDQEVILRLPGGGGFYPPFERDPELVRQDVINGYISVQGVHREYGVWIEEGTWAIDWAKTAALRKSR